MAEKQCSSSGCTKESCEGCPSKNKPTSFQAVSYTHLEDDRLLVNMASGTPAMKSALLIMATLAEYRFLPIQVSTPHM